MVGGSHAFMAMLKPLPSSPRRFSAGTRTASRLTAQVGCAFQPVLASCLPKLSPGVPCKHASFQCREYTSRVPFLPCSSTHAPTRSSLPKTLVLQDHEAPEMRPSNLKQLATADFTLSTRKAEMPLGPGPPVRAMTRYTSEAPPPLMKALLPYAGG